MLNDWGIYHIHLGLSASKDKKGYIENTDEILFLIPYKETLHLITVDDHNSFSNKQMLDIVENNWFEIIKPYIFKGVKDLTYTIDSNGIKILRNAGINGIIKTKKGNVVAPIGGGVASNKTATNQIIQSNCIRRQLKQLEEQLRNKPKELNCLFQIKNDKDWDNLVFELVSLFPVIKVEETTTNQMLSHE